MTRRKLSYPIEKVTLELRSGDFDRLATLYGRQHVSEAIRNLIIHHLNCFPQYDTNYMEEET